jgi:hypothetical protein|tara:strand:- start:385 stop:1254 length:870 start_codon:yes stop_codon:yes gene_type:complete
MAKVSAKQLVDLLQNAGANTEDIPTLVMISFYESNLESVAENQDTTSVGLFQINADQHFKNGKPDNTLSSFAGKDITLEEFETKLKDPQYNAEFAVHYLKVIREDLEDGSSQFGMVTAANNDPFGIWEAYTDYVLPYLSGEMPAGRGNNADEKKSDVVAGINSYVDAYYTLGMETNNNEPVVEETQTKGNPNNPVEPTLEPSGLGQERRESGYSEREIAKFNRATEKIAKMMNPTDPTNLETIRQSQLYLANQVGMNIQEIPLDVRSNYGQIDAVIMNFVGQLGKMKAR